MSQRGGCGGDDSLAVAQAAVAGADAAMLEDLEAFFLKPNAQQPGQPAIVQAPAGECDGIDPGFYSRIGGSVDKSPRYSGVKTGTDSSRVFAASQVGEKSLPHAVQANYVWGVGFCAFA